MDTCIFFVEKRRNVSKLRGTDAWAEELERAKRVGDTEKLRKMSKTEEERMVVIHLAEGFEEVEALTAADILRRAGKQVVLVSVTDDPLVTGAHNITVKADCLFEEVDYAACEMLVLPGGMPGTKHLDEHRGLCEKLTAFAHAGKWIAAICAAPMVLGRLGLLEGRHATLYPGMESYLIGAVCEKQAVVRDGNLITSQGPGTAMLFALALVEALCSGEVHRQIADELILQQG